MQKTEHKINRDTLKTVRGETPRERLLHRLHCVALALKGYSASEAARIFGDSPRAVAYWVTRFKADGIDGLKEEARAGRPSKLNATQLKKVQILLNRSKGNSKKENAEMLSAYIRKEFKISLTPRQCWRILNRLTS